MPGVRRRPSWPVCEMLAAWPMATLAVERCRVVGSADPPFRYLRQQEAGGLYYELLRAAAARAGWPLEFSEVPAARALLLMQSGEADLMVGPLRRLEREAYLHYSRVTLPAEDKSVYARPGAAPLQRLEQLRGQRVGVLRGKRYGGGFDELTGLQRRRTERLRQRLADRWRWTCASRLWAGPARRPTWCWRAARPGWPG
jgi:ABC-type amino acid transport substrate-binding protein